MQMHHGGASSHYRSAARRRGNRTADQSGLHTALNDSVIAPIGSRTGIQMTGWGNVARAAISEVLPTF
jgi:hypothetical protein